MITFTTSGSFDKTEKFLNAMKRSDMFRNLDAFGREGVAALASATPRDSGLTAESWQYEVVHERGRNAVIFRNTNIVEGRQIAILIQYGHGTRTGGYVQGRDYINPVIIPLFERILNDVWNEVIKQ